MKNWITFGEIYLTIQTNAFLYYCTKLPFVHHFIRATWYGRYRLKRLFTVFGVLLGFVKEALATNLGMLFLLRWIPSRIAHRFFKLRY